jgi:hypothetical protein
MGLSSTTTATEAIKLCIFDLRRGQQEGQELDKILFFFPAHLPFSTQLSVIGLSEGLITFTRLELVLPLFHKAQPNGLLQLLEFSFLAGNLKSQHFFFTHRIFSPEAACEVIEAERHSHVFYEAEPDIWMVMVSYLFCLLLLFFFYGLIN